MISTIARINNRFVKYAAYRIYTMRTRLILLSICGVLSFPLFFFALSVYDRYESVNYVYNPAVNAFFTISVMLGCAALTGITLITYGNGISGYDYFNRRELVDMSNSLPLTNKERFWGDFVAGLLPTSVIYIISSVIGFLIAFFGFDFKEGSNNITDVANVMGMIAACMFIGFLFLVMLYIISVFCASLCGRIFEAAFYPFVICGIIPALIALFGLLVFEGVWQIDITDSIFNALAGSSPFGFLLCSFTDISSNWGNEGYKVTFLRLEIVIPMLLIFAAFLTVAYYFSKNRKAEKVGQAFAFKFASQIVLSLVMFCITAIFCYAMKSDSNAASGYFFGLVVCTAVTFLIFDVTAKRGFKKMGRAFLRYGAMVVCSSIISAIAMSAHGFGIGEYVPPTDQIRSVYLDVSFLGNGGVYDNTSKYSYDYMIYVGARKVWVDYTDSENIELLRQTNIDSNKNFYASDSYGYLNSRKIAYILKNGKTLTRTLRLSGDMLKKLMPLLASDEYKIANLNYLDSIAYGEEGELASVSFCDLASFNQTTTINKNDMLKLYEAYKQDLLNETYEQMFLTDQTNYGLINFSFLIYDQQEESRTYDHGTLILASSFNSNNYVSICIRPHYTNLIKAIESLGRGFTANYQQDYNISSTECNISKQNYITSSPNSAWYSGEYFYARDEFTYNDNFKDLDYAEFISELLKVVQPHYLIDGEGYVVYTNGFSYVLPPQYNDMVEKFFSFEYDDYGNRIYNDAPEKEYSQYQPKPDIEINTYYEERPVTTAIGFAG